MDLRSGAIRSKSFVACLTFVNGHCMRGDRFAKLAANCWNYIERNNDGIPIVEAVYAVLSTDGRLRSTHDAHEHSQATISNHCYHLCDWIWCSSCERFSPHNRPTVKHPANWLVRDAENAFLRARVELTSIEAILAVDAGLHPGREMDGHHTPFQFSIPYQFKASKSQSCLS